MPIVEVVIEVPRGGFVKRRPDGSTDFISPVPCPFNYGSVLGSIAADGDPQDALVLGPKVAVGDRLKVTVWERVEFLDDGVPDDKWICGVDAPTVEDKKRISRFFTFYAWAKVGLNLIRGRTGVTRFVGISAWDGCNDPHPTGLG